MPQPTLHLRRQETSKSLRQSSHRLRFRPRLPLLEAVGFAYRFWFRLPLLEAAAPAYRFWFWLRLRLSLAEMADSLVLRHVGDGVSQPVSPVVRRVSVRFLYPPAGLYQKEKKM